MLVDRYQTIWAIQSIPIAHPPQLIVFISQMFTDVLQAINLVDSRLAELISNGGK